MISWIKYIVSCYYLKKVIRTSIVDTFEFIELLRKHYDGNMSNALHSIQMEEYEKVRFNCYYLSKLLKEKLDEHNIKTEYITYQSEGFSTDIGDKIIKESHISIVWTTKKKNQKLFILFDPGLYIEKPFVFFQNSNSKKIKVKNCIFQIKNNNSKDYPMIQTIDGINRNSYSTEKYHLIKKLNPYYYTTNVEDMLFPISICLIPGFKISKTNGKNGAYIKLMYAHRYLEYYTALEKKKKRLTYDEIKGMPKELLKEHLHCCCQTLKKDIDDVISDIYFMIDHEQEYKSYIIDSRITNSLYE